MKKIILYLVFLTLTSLSCKNRINDSSEKIITSNSELKEGPCPETTIMFDYELKDIKTGKKMILINQEIPDAPECILNPGDTMRLCKSYGDAENDWHVETYYKGFAEVDHCEKMTSAILISIKKVTYHYKW